MTQKINTATTMLLIIGLFQLSFGQTTITMKKDGGVYTVPCTINGLKLKFIFDTGASDVCISVTEALFMLKNGYLQESDIMGSTYAQLANGEITKNTKIILHKIDIAGLSIYNISALVVHELGAPLLLGQSAMGKLGKFQFDPNNGTLTILNAPNKKITYEERETKQNGSTATVTDIDGNVYNTVTIGTQVWMAENLKVTKNNDGTTISRVTDATTIPFVTDATTWSKLTTSGYCWYNNDEITFKNTYGGLYNWYTVNMAKLCPIGWHVPTDAEWTTLTTYLGGETIAGGKLKEIASIHWSSPNTSATNSSRFSALPGGYRDNKGTFINDGNFCDYWSSTELNTYYAWNRELSYKSSNIFRIDFDKSYGFSVRCVKD